MKSKKGNFFSSSSMIDGCVAIRECKSGFDMQIALIQKHPREIITEHIKEDRIGNLSPAELIEFYELVNEICK